MRCLANGVEHTLSVELIMPLEFPWKQKYERANGALPGMAGSQDTNSEVTGNNGESPAVAGKRTEKLSKMC